MHEVGTPYNTTAEPSFSRRLLLRGSALAAGLAAVGIEAEYSDALVSRTLFSPNTDDMPTGLPPELQKVSLDTTNEHYQPNYSAVIGKGIERYTKTGGTPYYRRPDFYMSEFDAIAEKVREIRRGSETIPSVAADVPYRRLINFSKNNASWPAELYIFDPGSSVRPIVGKRLEAMGDAVHKQATGDAVIMDVYRQFFRGTLAHIDAVRGRGRVSTAELYAYFLGRNNGDLVTSLIDTTLFLKLAARCDLRTLQGHSTNNQLFSPAYQNARLVSSRFYDDFAATLPLEKFIRHVPAQSALNNFTPGMLPGVSKDYDPVNRAGLPYHAWNIFTLAACTDPAVVQQMIFGYYETRLENNNDTHLTQGRIKMEADIRAAKQVRNIRKVITRYAVD